MKQAIFISTAILITVMTACGPTNPHNTQSVIPNGWKIFEQIGYSIHYPDSFELSTSGQMGMSFMLLSKQTFPDDMFRENINLLIQDLSGLNINLDKYTEISENQVKTIITDGNIIEIKRIKNEHSEYQKMIYTGRQGQFNLKFEQYYRIKNNKAYILTLTAETEQFDNYKAVGEEILNSFMIN